MTIRDKQNLTTSRVGRTANQSLPSATLTQVQLNVVATTIPGFDPYSIVNTGTYSTTVREPGTYLILFSVHFDGEITPISQNYRYLDITVNGTNVAYPAMLPANDAASSDTVMHSSLVYDLEAGDVITAYVAQGSGETISIVSTHTKLSVVKLPFKWSN